MVPDFSAPRDPDPTRRLADPPDPTTASDPIQDPILDPTRRVDPITVLDPIRRVDPDSEVPRAVDPACPLYHPRQVHTFNKSFQTHL